LCLFVCVFVISGFSLDENEDNQVALFFTLPESDPHYPMKLRTLGGRKVNTQRRRFQIPIDWKEEVSKECFSFLRFIHAKDSELLLLVGDNFDIKKIEPLSIRNELAVVNHLAAASQEIFTGFETTWKEDNEMILKNEMNGTKLTFNQRN